VDLFEVHRQCEVNEISQLLKQRQVQLNHCILCHKLMVYQLTTTTRHA